MNEFMMHLFFIVAHLAFGIFIVYHGSLFILCLNNIHVRILGPFVRFYSIALVISFVFSGYAGTSTCLAQEADADSLRSYDLAPVVVTATRTAKELADVSVPMTVISSDELETRGVVRLTDALAEMTGLSLNFDHGAGIQVQGFDADYTLILIDGEPVIGRTTGTLDLERLTVSGIERIEVVEGPSSSLYGSEALAGVINIITKKAEEPLEASFRSRYGTHNTTDVSATLEAGGERVGLKGLINRYSSSGYDLLPELFGPTTPSFTDYTTDLRAYYKPGERTSLTLGARFAVQDQKSAFALENEQIPHSQTEDQIDWSVHPELRHRFSSTIEATGTFYTARFSTETEQRNQEDGTQFFFDSFEQHYNKAELQTNAFWNARHLTVFGGGVVWETLEGERYDDFTPEAQSHFFFVQHEWLPGEKLNVNVSARYDAHEDYASRVSPKLSLLLRPTDRLRFRFAVGSGFKAPAFRQLYLNFTNASVGYTVLGSTQLLSEVTQLEADGLLAATFIDPSRAEEIQAERSVAFNAGLSADLTSWLSVSLGGFHNNVRDLIETQAIAQKTNGAFVFSYFNLNRIYTRGLNFEMESSPLPWFTLATGYQYLEARDRDVVDAIEEGTVFGRTLAGRDYQLQLSDYDGLLGRSPHSGTVKAVLKQDKQNITWSLRGTWRNRYGYRDIDGNTIANLDEEFVPGYALWHTTFTKAWSFKANTVLTAQVGVTNLFDVTKPNLVPSLPGRVLFTSLQVSL